MAPTLPDDEDLVGRLSLSVMRLARLIRQGYPNGMAPTDAAMLATIAREGGITMGELATAEQVAPPTVTKAVGKLEAAGLVVREADPDDRRVSRVRLSGAAKRQIKRSRAQVNAWLAEQVADLTRGERARLAAAVDVLEHLATVATTARAR